MKVVTDASDGPVSTEDKPIVPSGLPLRCHKCGTEFEAGDGGKWVPGGHKKWCEFKCPSCGTRVAKQKGTNRAVFEDMIDLESVDEAFRLRCEDDDRDPDRYELVPCGLVDPEDVGDDVIAVFEYYPHNDVTNWLTVEPTDVFTDAGELREHGAAYAAASLIPNDIPAVVEYYEGHFKPFGYGDEFEDVDVDDLKPGRTNSVLRFVRVVDE